MPAAAVLADEQQAQRQRHSFESAPASVRHARCSYALPHYDTPGIAILRSTDLAAQEAQEAPQAMFAASQQPVAVIIYCC